MLRVYACITEQHDLRFVLLAGLVCFLACFTALSIRERSVAALSGPARVRWLTVAATVFGCGVWTTHFVAMLAFRPNLPIGYDVVLTALSIAAAISISWLGLWIALGNARLAPTAGGGVVGASVGAMHYIGMAAMRVPATVEWDWSYVVASLIIGIALGGAALRLVARVPTLQVRLVGSTVLCAGIVGLHFSAMAGAVLVPDPRIPLPDELIAPEWLAVAVASVTILIVGMGLVGAIVDQHLAGRVLKDAERLRAHIAELEAKHQKTTERLVRSERLSLLGQVAGTVSHELRNPLGAIRTSTALVRQLAMGKVAGVERSLERIDRNLDRCVRIVGDLLEYTREKHIQREKTAIDDWLAEILNEIGARNDIRLVRDFRSRSDVAIDAMRLRQVIVNLIDNAMQALLDKTWRRPDGHQSLVIVRTENAGPVVKLSVSDNGPGIAAENLCKIFEPLFTTKSFGVGLGLSTVRELVEKHGGTIDVMSLPGHGANFTISLPLHVQESAEQSNAGLIDQAA